ncbi:hypothetical protein SETIT_4G264600v2 [Setaria italica]|uniref:Uncharacterized protein n=1 Tax=Setaria italica TaxID=4555 RepID=A0A368QYG8_SETIT|nr:uncharacterized protein LOC101759878 [Setaria italica]RCV22996.1 hypothetical protein SETIT_4G264600v2 [Setaria italica]
MESSPAKQEIRDESAAAAAAGGGGGVVLGAQRQLIDLGLVVRRRLQSAALFLFWGFMGALGALRQLIELEVLNLLQAAVLFLFRACSGGVGALRQLIEPEDRRVQAAAFFLAFGGCTVLNGTALNRSVNPEHLFAGFFMFNIGAAMAILTLASGGAGRAADRMERFLRGFF